MKCFFPHQSALKKLPFPRAGRVDSAVHARNVSGSLAAMLVNHCERATRYRRRGGAGGWGGKRRTASADPRGGDGGGKPKRMTQKLMFERCGCRWCRADVKTYPVTHFLRLETAGQQLTPQLDEPLAKHRRRCDSRHRARLSAACRLLFERSQKRSTFFFSKAAWDPSMTTNVNEVP
jgi:hypothetical protein